MLARIDNRFSESRQKPELLLEQSTKIKTKAIKSRSSKNLTDIKSINSTINASNQKVLIWSL